MSLLARIALLLGFAFALLGAAGADAASPWAKYADPVFVRLDTRELPEPAVMALAQDRAGFLWVGTQGGLARFDGYHYRSYLPNPNDPKALPDGYIRTLLADASGGVWIGSSSNGLVHFDAATETFHTWRADPAGIRGPRSGSVDALAYANDGLWIGGDRGLGRYDATSGRFTSAVLPAAGAQPVVWALFVDHGGTLWAGTQGGLFYRSAGARRFRAYPLAAARGAAPIIYSLSEDHAGRIWAGSTNAVYVVDAGRHGSRVLRSSPQDPATLAPGQQWSVTEVRPNVIWAGTDSAISMIDASTLRIRRLGADVKNPGGLSGGRVVQVLRERSGLVLIANHVGGLLLYNPFTHGLYAISATRPEYAFNNEGVSGLAAAPGNRLWAGGVLGHLAEFQPPDPIPHPLALANHAAVQTLMYGSDGTLWIGTTAGLCRLDRGQTQARCPAQPAQLATASIYALLQDGKRLWIGGGTGLLTEDLTTGRVTPYAHVNQLSNNQVRALWLDRRRRLWVGTENGLDRIDPNGRIVRFAFTPGDPNSIGPGGVAALYEDRRGWIWAGAQGGPLDVLQDQPDGTMRIHQIGLADGMPHENVDGLEEDSRGRIWASTDKGIALIDPVTLHARGFGQADGVSEDAYWAGTSTEATDGTMFFGGLDGISVVAPDAVSNWNYAPPIVVSALQLGRKNVPAWGINTGNAQVELPADARDISVEFTALDYSAPQSLRYAYKLDGYDREWIDGDAQHRIAVYTHLVPGDYTLEVRGTNRLGVWSTHELRLGIRAVPAWYETWWFRMFLGVLVVLIGLGVHNLRTAVLRRRQRELEAIVDTRTRELSQANMKLQELSLSDPLTGLRNRRFLTQHLEADIALTLRRYEDWTADPVADAPEDADILFFLIDLDHFKDINDRFGHPGGDAVLIGMRERLQEVFRESDFVVRWGGDEFLTVARGSRRSEAPLLAERIREVVAGRAFTLSGGQTVTTTVSVGFAAFPIVPRSPGEVAWPQVVAIADHALYMAKEAGRNRWFGLTANERTDPSRLLGRAEGSVADAVRAGALDVVRNVVRA